MKKMPLTSTLGAAAALFAFTSDARADYDPECMAGVEITFQSRLSSCASKSDPEYTDCNLEAVDAKEHDKDSCWREPELHCGWTSCWYC